MSDLHKMIYALAGFLVRMGLLTWKTAEFVLAIKTVHSLWESSCVWVKRRSDRFVQEDLVPKKQPVLLLEHTQKVKHKLTFPGMRSRCGEVVFTFTGHGPSYRENNLSADTEKIITVMTKAISHFTFTCNLLSIWTMGI